MNRSAHIAHGLATAATGWWAMIWAAHWLASGSRAFDQAPASTRGSPRLKVELKDVTDEDLPAAPTAEKSSRKRNTGKTYTSYPCAFVSEILALAQQGIPVFPCRLNKAPLTRNGFKDATTDEETIREWWRRYPNALVAIPTGEMSGICVIDIDPDGIEWLDRNREMLEPGMVQHTSRGFHLYYRDPGESRCSIGSIHPGVDVRGDGGYVIAWGFHKMDAEGTLADITELPVPELAYSEAKVH